VVFGTVARLVPQKALGVLLEAFARLRDNRTPSAAPVKLVIVGRGPLERELRSKANQLGLGSDCIWAGFRTDIPLVLAALDVFVLTSAWEGLGLVLLEAIAAGKPIVATRVDAIPEIVAEGETGLLCAPGDIAGIADAMETFCEPGLRGRFGSAGRARLEQFSLQRVALQTLELYAECLR